VGVLEIDNSLAEAQAMIFSVADTGAFLALGVIAPGVASFGSAVSKFDF